MNKFYPTLVSEKFVATINFYEDFFGFVPAVEQDGYALMQSSENPSLCFALIDKNHGSALLPKASSEALIINVVVPDVKSKYDDLYMEGLEIRQDITKDHNGCDHFIVSDPNGIMINIHAPLDLALAG